MQPDLAMPAGSAAPFPDWLDSALVADSRFASAYEALGAEHRARLKRTIAAHYTLAPPEPCLGARSVQSLRSGLRVERSTRPRPFAILVTEGFLEAPAFFLAALMPLLTSGIPEILVLRLGAASRCPEALLCACELAGQERVACLSAERAAALIASAASGSAGGLVVLPQTPAAQRLLSRQELAGVLDRMACATLRPPASLALWRDKRAQFPEEELRFFYGQAEFLEGSQQVSRKVCKGGDFSAFACPGCGFELLLVPDDRGLTAHGAAPLVVAEADLGLHLWPELGPSALRLLHQTVGRDGTPAA